MLEQVDHLLSISIARWLNRAAPAFTISRWKSRAHNLIVNYLTSVNLILKTISDIDI